MQARHTQAGGVGIVGGVVRGAGMGTTANRRLCAVGHHKNIMASNTATAKKRKNEANKRCANVARLQLVEFFKGIAGSGAGKGGRKGALAAAADAATTSTSSTYVCVRACVFVTVRFDRQHARI